MEQEIQGEKMQKVNENQEPNSGSSENLRPAAETADGQSGLVGRELDAVVAERVMGWKRELNAWYTPQGKAADIQNIPLYSTDNGVAMEVIEKMKQSHNMEIWGYANGGWCVCFEPESVRRASAGGPDFADVICRAALAVR